MYKWTKSSSLEINILGFKNDGEKWPGFFFVIHRAPSEIPANPSGQFSPKGQILGHWAAAALKGLGAFQKKKKKKSRPLFTLILSQKCKFQNSRF